MTQAAVGQVIAKNMATAFTKELTHVEFMGCNPSFFSGNVDTKEFLKWFEELETIFQCGDCRNEDKVKFATCTFQEHAQKWWTKHVQVVGVDAAYSHSWEKLKRMMSLKFCVKSELQAIEQETLNLTMVGDDVVKYTASFYDLARLGSVMDEPESKKLERYIGGLSPEIRMLVSSLKPDTMPKAIRMAIEAKERIAHTKILGRKSDNKKKWNNNRGENATRGPHKRQRVAKPNAAGLKEKNDYLGILPKCDRCQKHHNPGRCPDLCGNCKKLGHHTKDCRLPIVGDNQRPSITCFECGVMGHFKSECPVLRDRNWRKQFMF
jgi:hypothetical protein